MAYAASGSDEAHSASLSMNSESIEHTLSKAAL